MIVSNALAKVGHRQTPYSKTPLQIIGRGVFSLGRAITVKAPLGLFNAQVLFNIDLTNTLRLSEK
jgi:hypothetical protein